MTPRPKVRIPSCRAVLATLLLVLLVVPVLVHAAARPAPDHTVRLIVDYNDGVQKVFPALGWEKGMTVYQALKAAEGFERGIKAIASGEGETTFVTSIDGLQNEGGGGKKNWVYWVNTSLGDRSSGVYGLEPGDVVLWKFHAGRPE